MPNCQFSNCRIINNTIRLLASLKTGLPKQDKSTLFNEGDTQQSSTDKPVALEFPIELEFRNVGF